MDVWGGDQQDQKPRLVRGFSIRITGNNKVKWKDVVTGAAITLLVTILGGIVVYYLTKEEKIEKNEDLKYKIESPVSFEGSGSKLSISNIILENIGAKKAENVKIEIHSASKNISEAKASSSLGGTINSAQAKIVDGTVNFSIPTLLPEERISISLLLNTASLSKPDVTIRSDSSVAKLSTPNKLESKKETNEFLPKLLVILITVFLPMAVILILKLKKYSPNRVDSLNNFAFVLLHQGDVAKAKNLLESAINKGEGGSHVLANYALCLAASGDSTQANKYISASEFYASSDHDKSIVLFNKAIISLTQGNEEKFINELKEAVKKSKNEIFSYLNYSEFTKEIIKKSEIKEAISLI